MNSKTCDDCSQYDEKIYNFDKKPVLPRHPMCRCYYDIVDDESNKTHKIGDNSKENENRRNLNKDYKKVQYCIDRMEKLGVHNIDIKHINNGEVLSPLLDELEKLKNEYGLMFNKIESIEISDKTIAQVRRRVLQLNGRYFNDEEVLQKQLDEWFIGKFIPKNCNNIEYVSTHEYFHLLTQDEIDNTKSKVRVLFNRANEKYFVCINSTMNPYEFTADLLSINRLNGLKNKSIDKLIKIFGGE